jgi:hypothetical protein
MRLPLQFLNLALQIGIFRFGLVQGLLQYLIRCGFLSQLLLTGVQVFLYSGSIELGECVHFLALVGQIFLQGFNALLQGGHFLLEILAAIVQLAVALLEILGCGGFLRQLGNRLQLAVDGGLQLLALIVQLLAATLKLCGLGVQF